MKTVGPAHGPAKKPGPGPRSIMSFSDPELLDPIVHCFARCYLCRKLIRIAVDNEGELILEERKCPHCGVFLHEDQLETSFLINHVHTSSITSANKILGMDLAVIPFIGVGVLLVSMDFPLWFRIVNLLFYLTPIILIARWLYRYWYEFRFTDEEYLDALQGMKKSLMLWTFANLLNWTLLLL